MMPDLNILRQLFREESIVDVGVDAFGRRVLVLDETGADQPYAVEIRDVPAEAIAVRADEGAAPIFRGDRGECKRADFVIFAWAGRRNWVVCVELKRGGWSSEHDVICQLMGAECLVKYWRAIGRSFWEREDFLEEENYGHRFVCIADIGINKRPTRHRRHEAAHDSPRNMLRIRAPGRSRLWFAQLVGGDGG